MNVQFDWPDDVVERYTQKAKQYGMSLHAYVLESVSRRYNAEATDEEKRSQHRDAVAAIRELRKQVKPDPEGLTSQDYLRLGRR